jgi:hypothetical protein
MLGIHGLQSRKMNDYIPTDEEWSRVSRTLPSIHRDPVIFKRAGSRYSAAETKHSHGKTVWNRTVFSLRQALYATPVGRTDEFWRAMLYNESLL